MKHAFLNFASALFIAATLVIGGCGGNDAATTNTAGTGSLADELEVNVPTQEQADADAAREITADNADAAFEALQQEIEGE